MSDEPLLPASNGRMHDGRFGKGNEFGKGNPGLKRVHALRSKLLGAISDDSMERIGKKLVELAEAGDLDAIKILLAYTIGKPPAALALTGEDGGPVVMGHLTLQKGAAELNAWRRTMTERLVAQINPDEETDTPNDGRA